MVNKITKELVIEQYLDDYSRVFYLREIASVLGKPHQSVKPFMEQLVKECVLIKDKRKNIVDYKLNFKDKKIYDYLVIAEKNKLLRRMEKDTLLKTLFEKLYKYFDESTFLVFGSFAKQGKAEDIDLLVIGNSDIKQKVGDFEAVYNKKIHAIQVRNIDEINIALTKEIFKKHLIFNNTESIVRRFGELHEKNQLV